MTRILKRYTTIPQNLYVNRKADKQLESIIGDMQRPGYVLVARQMGKTNLLFNAKRQLENSRRLFAYVDMSNVFKKERECYQNIIDCIIEPNSEKFSIIGGEIDIIRNSKLPPHKEYMRSLRVLLKSFDGDLIIILDEIDALKTSDYSDNIFAQIRSNYFSRTNFSEFERLTYVLSGVIDPIELIKDRNKSPFNIGEKIYLDDFTREEYLSFLDKSGLLLSDEISNHVFSWVNGNPRLTFDICSEIELFLIENGNIRTIDIDNIIKNKYLNSFDVAPVDHIRALVIDNIEVINVLISMYDDDFEKINDELQKKLYLYGITDSSFKDKPDFKNKIIKLTLNLDWLINVRDSINNRSLTLSQALLEFDLGKYRETVDICKLLLEKEDSSDDFDVITYFLGFSHYKLGEHKSAIQCLSYNFKTELYKNRGICISGISKILIGEVEEGQKNLRSIIDCDDNFSSHNAMINLARIEEDNQISLELWDRLFISASLSQSEKDSKENKSYCFASLYFTHEIHIKTGEFDKAKAALDKAFEYTGKSESFILQFSLAKLKNDSSETCTDIINYIINNKLTFENNENEFGLGFSHLTLCAFLNYSFNRVEREHFIKVFDYIREVLLKSNSKSYNLLYEAALTQNFNKDILLFLLDESECINENLLLKIYIELVIENIQNEELFLFYFHKFNALEVKDDTFNETRLYVYMAYIDRIFKVNNISKMQHHLAYLENKVSNYANDEILTLASSLIHFWKGIVLNRIGYDTASYDSFKKCSSIINGSSFKSTKYFSERHFSSINNYESNFKPNNYLAYDYIKKASFSSPLKKYTNKQLVKVLYFSNGNIKTGKYKKFIDDINSSKCQIIEDL